MQALPDRLPLAIGVTGHRDLRDQDIPRLEQEVAAIFARLRRDYLGDDGETPVVVVSALAEGADRLVVRVALREGARLIAPMPMPIAEYRRDFEPGLKPGNAAEFDELLAQAMAAPVMPFTPGNSLEAVQADPGKRNEQYRSVGRFITLHCDALIALWDGDTDMVTGGTAEVVTFKQQGIPLDVSGSARASLDASEIGPVVHVVTPRNKESSTVNEVSVRPWGRALAPRSLFARGEKGSPIERETWETFETLTALTRQFNREASALASAPDGPARVQHNLVQLFDSQGAPEPLDSAAAMERACGRAPRWCALYAIADTLAQECQTRFRRDWVYLFSFAFVGLVCFDVFSHFFPRALPLADLLLAGYFLAFLLAFLVYGAASKGQHQERFLDYRVLAEALRVGVFWKLAGLARSAADAYPIRQPSELAWVKVCLRGLELVDTAFPPAASPGLDQADHALARGIWVHGQYRYYFRRGPQHEHTAHWWETAAGMLFALAPFCFAVILVAVDLRLFGLGGDEWIDGHLRHYLIAVMGLLPALAAVVVGFTEKLAFNAQARQYDRMRMLFERGYHMLPAAVGAGNAHLAQALYAELGSEAMMEHAEWVAIYRQRPIRPPQG